MFGLFKKNPTIAEYAETAEIHPVAENGDYTAFLVQVLDSARNFGAEIRKNGNQDAVGKFVEIIDRRLSAGEFESLFDLSDDMQRQHGLEPVTRNLNAERVVICKGEDGYVFKWNP